jgi:hypothetical protein
MTFYALVTISSEKQNFFGRNRKRSSSDFYVPASNLKVGIDIGNWQICLVVTPHPISGDIQCMAVVYLVKARRCLIVPNLLA